MAQQDGGWPLGLQPLNGRARLTRSLDFSGSLSFSTLITGSSTSRSSSAASSDIDVEVGKSITLGSLIGISSILELSSRSFRRSRRPVDVSKKVKKKHKRTTWFSLCTKPAISNEKDGGAGAGAGAGAQSLGHFLEVERRASVVQRGDQIPVGCERNSLDSTRFVASGNGFTLLFLPCIGDQFGGQCNH